MRLLPSHRAGVGPITIAWRLELDGLHVSSHCKNIATDAIDPTRNYCRNTQEAPGR